MTHREYLARKSKQWQSWARTPGFELLALGILRDLESRAHQARSHIGKKTASSAKRRSILPDSTRLRRWLDVRPLPATLETVLQETRGTARALPTPAVPASAPASPGSPVLPSVLGTPHLRATDRPWEERILQAARHGRCPVVAIDLELQLQGLGPFETAARDWALDRGWVLLLAETSPDPVQDREKTFRARWYLAGLAQAPAPDWSQLATLPGAAPLRGAVKTTPLDPQEAA